MRYRAPRFPKTFRTVSTAPAGGVAPSAAQAECPPVVEGVLPCEGDGVVLAIFLEDEIAYLMSEGVLRPEDTLSR